MESTILTRIEMSRKQLGISGRELARRAKLSRTHISMIQRRNSNITIETAAKLAEALGCSLDWLVSGVGQGPETPQGRA